MNLKEIFDSERICYTVNVSLDLDVDNDSGYCEYLGTDDILSCIDEWSVDSDEVFYDYQAAFDEGAEIANDLLNKNPNQTCNILIQGGYKDGNGDIDYLDEETSSYRCWLNDKGSIVII